MTPAWGYNASYFEDGSESSRDGTRTGSRFSEGTRLIGEDSFLEAGDADSGMAFSDVRISLFVNEKPVAANKPDAPSTQGNRLKRNVWTRTIARR